MQRIPLEIVDRSLPGAAPVSEHSIFSSVAEAVRAGAEEVLRPSPPLAETLRPSVSLAGEWYRLPLEADGPPTFSEDDPKWQAVFVPDNFGLEPSLSAHFGPVFYARRLPESRAPCRLVFDAVDYLCDAWLDGQHLGRHEGYFAPFAFELEKGVRKGALLVVRVQDPFEDLDPKQPFVLHPKRVIKGVLKYHDSRPGGLPGRHTPSWTPREGQSLSTGGIIGDVRLEELGVLSVDALFVTPLDAATGKIHVALFFTKRRGAPLEALIRLEIAPPGPASENARSGDVRLPARTAKWAAEFRLGAPEGPSRVDLELVLPDPVTWWPRSHADLGGPALYELRARVIASEEAASERRARFGLRTAEVVGEPKRFVLNGRPIFVQATNYIPRQHFAGVSRALYDRDMKLIGQAHLNSVGVHGHVQCPACYAASDEAGILVFQDFALQWHYDAGKTTNPGFVEIAGRQIAEMGYALYNHPSVVYWACHNEPTALFIPNLAPDPERDPDNQLLDAELEARLRKVDPCRHVHRASGIGDDLHVYDGSLLGGSVYDVRKHETWFVSEFGFWTVGRAAERWGDVLWPPDAARLKKWHSRLSFAPSTFAFAGLPERYPSLASFRRATEAYGAFLAKYQTEWFRIRRGQPFHAYRWHFFCDWWGWAGGGLVDVDREPKATYAALAAASRPVLLATSLAHTVFAPGASLSLPIYGINELRKSVAVSVSYRFSRSERSLVIGADSEVSERYSVPGGTPGAMVALPEDSPVEAPKAHENVLLAGTLEARLAPESARQIGEVRVAMPAEPLTGGLFELEWGERERNYYYLFAAEPDWFCGPGAFIVGPGVLSRLEGG